MEAVVNHLVSYSHDRMETNNPGVLRIFMALSDRVLAFSDLLVVSWSRHRKPYLPALA